ncbi:hypothetical protein SUGI_1067770 [Cryptomeria japonica]|uniref:transcription factor MYB8 n=1 Tax=Cryptomeria japonica TaxID=3369 RepID=UPI0024148220|nr:transcription factor MYB8 [Cryptomeria japonica]GLJ50181.1 hypothetical protein SUGI_1067770 [Cryptomeria japonica]
MGRRPCCDKMGVRKGHWTPQEDKILVDFIHKNGPGNWRALPEQAGLLRCGKSCRLRWINYLRADIKRGDFSSQEEAAIIQLHKLLGNRWSIIASRLPGRTDNEIKNLWNTHLKKRLGNDSSSGQILISMQESTSTKEVAHANNLSLTFPSQLKDSPPDFPNTVFHSFYDSHKMSSEIFQSDCLNSSAGCKQHSSTVADDLLMDETFVLKDEERWLAKQNQNLSSITTSGIFCESSSNMEAQYFMSSYLEDDLLSCMDDAGTNTQSLPNMKMEGNDDGSDCTDYWFKVLRQI